MDDETAQLILDFQIFDLEAALDRSFGKRFASSTPGDAEVAMQDQLLELQHTKTLISDMRMLESLKRADIDNFGILTILEAQENAAAQDRAMALRLGGYDVPDEPVVRLAPFVSVCL